MPIDYRTHREAVVERGVTLGAFVVVCEGARISTGTVIAPFAYIGPGVTVGAGAQIGPHAVVLGDVPPGAVIEPGAVWKGDAIARRYAEATDPVVVGPANFAITSAAPTADAQAIAETVLRQVVKRGKPRK